MIFPADTGGVITHSVFYGCTWVSLGRGLHTEQETPTYTQWQHNTTENSHRSAAHSRTVTAVTSTLLKPRSTLRSHRVDRWMIKITHTNTRQRAVIWMQITLHQSDSPCVLARLAAASSGVESGREESDSLWNEPRQWHKCWNSMAVCFCSSLLPLVSFIKSVLTQTVPVSQHSLMLFTITVLKFDFLQVKKNNKKPAQTISNNVTMQREEDKKIIIAKKNIKRENNC